MQIEDWQMFGVEGNLAVSQMMLEMKQALSNQPLPKKKYGEVYDTEVRYRISSRLTAWASEVHDLKSVFGFNSQYWDL